MDNVWWIKEEINWSNIGADVVSRPTEVEALNNISQQAKHIREVGYDYEDIKLTKTERYLYELELLVSSEDFNPKEHPKVLIKDSYLRRVSKISGYSEPFVLTKLSSVTKKFWLAELFGLDVFAEKENPNERNRKRKLVKRYEYYKNKGIL